MVVLLITGIVVEIINDCCCCCSGSSGGSSGGGCNSGYGGCVDGSGRGETSDLVEVVVVVTVEVQVVGG